MITVKIMIDAEDRLTIVPVKLKSLKIPHNFSDVLHNHLAEESESPIVAESVNTTNDEGKRLFRLTINEALELSERRPYHFHASITSKEAPSLSDYKIALRTDVENWVENVVNADVKITYLIFQD